MIKSIILILIAWLLIGHTINVFGNAFYEEFQKLNKNLDYIAGFLEEIRDKLRD